MKLTSILCGLGLAALGSCQNCAVANVSALALTGVDVGRYQNVSGSKFWHHHHSPSSSNLSSHNVHYRKRVRPVRNCIPNRRIWHPAAGEQAVRDTHGQSETASGVTLTPYYRLADSFGRADYLVVAPDMFNGTPSMVDIDVETPYTDQFLATNDVNQTDAIVAQAISFIKTFPNVKRVGATGYCFGGRFSFRAGAKGFGAEVIFAAHPANLVDAEISAVSGPASVAAAGE